jgi:hypothetical protein
VHLTGYASEGHIIHGHASHGHAPREHVSHGRVSWLLLVFVKGDMVYDVPTKVAITAIEVTITAQQTCRRLSRRFMAVSYSNSVTTLSRSEDIL